MNLLPYPEYKDSGVEWFGDVPLSWSTVSIRRYVSFKNGADYKHIEVAGGGYPVIGSGGEFRRASEFMYDGESVLFGRKGTIDKPLYVNTRFWTVDTMYYTTVDVKHLVVRFLYYWATTLPYAYYVTSTALPSMTQSDLGSVKMALPALVEQQAIADYLDHETAEIDAFIADQNELIGLLNERRATTIDTVVWSGLDAEVPTGEVALEPIPDAPLHWQRLRNKNVFEERRGLSVHGEEELLTVSHITGVTPRSDKQVNMTEALSHENYKLVERGDLAINTMWAWMGAMGVADYYGIVSPAYGVYRPIQDDYHGRYFDYLYRSRQYVCAITRFSRGLWSSRLRLYPDVFLAMPVVVPPLEEQQQISDYLDHETAEIDAAIADAKEAIKLSKERRAALISAAVTGKIDVRDHASAEGQA